MMEKENLTNPIDEDLERRNRNWDKIDKLKEDLEEEVGELRDDLAEHKLDYAEYLESELGEEHIIRSLPNGTKDEIRVGEGKAIIRTKKYVLQAKDIATLSTNGTNVDYVVINKPTDFIYYNVNIQSGQHGAFILDNYTEKSFSQSTYDSMEFINSVSGRPASTTFWLVIPKGTFVDLTDARNKLTGLTLTYQLAEPEIIDLPEVMTPNTREIVRLSEQVDKLTAAIIAMGGTIV